MAYTGPSASICGNLWTLDCIEGTTCQALRLQHTVSGAEHCLPADMHTNRERGRDMALLSLPTGSAAWICSLTPSSRLGTTGDFMRLLVAPCSSKMSFERFAFTLSVRELGTHLRSTTSCIYLSVTCSSNSDSFHRQHPGGTL